MLLHDGLPLLRNMSQTPRAMVTCVDKVNIPPVVYLAALSGDLYFQNRKWKINLAIVLDYTCLSINLKELCNEPFGNTEFWVVQEKKNFHPRKIMQSVY